jgi:hypothetical protein
VSEAILLLVSSDVFLILMPFLIVEDTLLFSVSGLAEVFLGLSGSSFSPDGDDGAEAAVAADATSN